MTGVASAVQRTAASLGSATPQRRSCETPLNVYWASIMRAFLPWSAPAPVCFQPRDDGLALQDLVTCKVGDTIVSIMSDVNAFWAYDNREMLMSHNTDEET